MNVQEMKRRLRETLEDSRVSRDQRFSSCSPLPLRGGESRTRVAFTSKRDNLLIVPHTSLVTPFLNGFDAMWNDFA